MAEEALALAFVALRKCLQRQGLVAGRALAASLRQVPRLLGRQKYFFRLRILVQDPVGLAALIEALTVYLHPLPPITLPL